nr:hypothetical protein [uncultured Ottowia sp.]
MRIGMGSKAQAGLVARRGLATPQSDRGRAFRTHGRTLNRFPDFHKHFYKSYVGKPVGDLDKEGPVNAQELERALQVGALFAGHGMAASLNAVS